MENLEIYNQVRAVPDNALRPITSGRLAGKSDINPMWRIKVLTGQFGPCGIGWKYTIDKQWLEESPGTNEIAGFCDITLYYKYKGEWSEGIPGTGGSTFVAKEKNGLHMSDEVFKMALTDALSVACKALGIGADVYWGADRSKYYTDAPPPPAPNPPPPPTGYDKDAVMFKCERCGKGIMSYYNDKGEPVGARKHCEGSKLKFGQVLCLDCIEVLNAGGNTNA